EHPTVEANRLRDLPDCYKIKLRQVGYRLIYQVHDEKVSILVVAIGKRDKSEAYKDAGKRV
ncbi:type II toxin-antitoxin system RelE/ParE family toxin, partial [Pseudoalteromonas sp. RB2-MNA-CIBAN-0110]|uniref:type II toxin-antitoxin system RelE family toxin n=1 Tax=Pseudoalteromonas sp. RB2-MNA-CIBAN-0110 TaxID=3140439 RepID=UPI0033184404